MSEIRVAEYVAAVKENGELKSQLADLAERLAVRSESLNAALESRAAILAIASELASKCVQTNHYCVACESGVAPAIHRTGCPVTRLEAF